MCMCACGEGKIDVYNVYFVDSSNYKNNLKCPNKNDTLNIVYIFP